MLTLIALIACTEPALETVESAPPDPGLVDPEMMGEVDYINHVPNRGLDQC